MGLNPIIRSLTEDLKVIELDIGSIVVRLNPADLNIARCFDDLCGYDSRYFRPRCCSNVKSVTEVAPTERILGSNLEQIVLTRLELLDCPERLNKRISFVANQVKPLQL